MKQFNEIKWSEVARRAIEQRVYDLEIMDKIASKTKLTQRDALELAQKIKKSATQRFLEAE